MTVKNFKLEKDGGQWNFVQLLSKIVQTMGKFRCEGTVQTLYADTAVDIKSILGLMSLCTNWGEEVCITLFGPDEDEAMDALKDLFKRG